MLSGGPFISTNTRITDARRADYMHARRKCKSTDLFLFTRNGPSARYRARRRGPDRWRPHRWHGAAMTGTPSIIERIGFQGHPLFKWGLFTGLGIVHQTACRQTPTQIAASELLSVAIDSVPEAVTFGSELGVPFDYPVMSWGLYLLIHLLCRIGQKTRCESTHRSTP